MPIKEDILTILENPRIALDRLIDMHERAQRYDLLNEIFIERSYEWLYRKINRPTVLIDIGANIGDTPIYFSSNPNITYIHAYEPYPYLFAKAKKNTRAMGKITMINGAISGETGYKTISALYKATAKSKFDAVGGRNLRRVHSFTVDDAIRFAGKAGTRNIAIKCDCEGCEAAIFSNARLNGVYAMQIEYHSAVILAALSRQLKHKFSIRVRTSKEDTDTGFVFAWRRMPSKATL